MQKKHIILITLSIALASAIFYFQSDASKSNFHPKPSNGLELMMQMEGHVDKSIKKRWLEEMHKAAEGIDWRSVESKTAFNKHLKRVAQRKNAGEEFLKNEELISGQLVGTWLEKGSLNQSGSVFEVDYYSKTDELFLISDGGVLYKGKRDGSKWEVVNQDLVFTRRIMEIITDESDNDIMLGGIDNLPHYSLDMGKTWQTSEGIAVDGRSHTKDFLTVGEEEIVFLLNKPSWWSNINLYISRDHGKTYSVVKNFNTSNFNNIAITNPHNTDELYLIEQLSETESKMYKYNFETNTLDIITENSPTSFGSGRGNLDGAAYSADEIHLIMYNGNNELFRSIDEGLTWNMVGTLPVRPWEVGLFMSKSNPNVMFIGDIECYRTENGGANWNKVNNWWDYYGNVEFDLHADMMTFNEYQTPTGENFILISNHGGISISYDEGLTNQNISLEGLNVSQYYSVRSYPSDDSWIFAGSQDQGFQRGKNDNVDIPNYDQVISGDYGHIVFSENGTRLWTVYPGGWVTYYPNPRFGGYTHAWEVNSDNETVWIPPLIPSPIEEENAIYMAGGNMNGGPGSHIIKLAFNEQTNSIETSQFPFDFRASNGEVSAMAVSPFNKDKWYVLTTTGAIYISEDGGQNFALNGQNAPGAHYLYGACVLPSKLDSNVVYISGSGYSNPGVLKSVDGGQSFEAMTNGLPSTLTFNIVANEDESLIFAATEAGPYVYSTIDDQWYDMAGTSAPNQRYWTVEYLENSKTVRFGTYGRGVWDFVIRNGFTADAYKHEACVGEVYDIQLDLDDSFTEESINLIGSDLPFGAVLSFDDEDPSPNSSVTASIDLTNAIPGTYYFDIQAKQAFRTEILQMKFDVMDVPQEIGLSLPENESEEVTVIPTIQWESTNSATRYRLELSFDENFSDIVFSEEVDRTFYIFKEIEALEYGQNYFWRVISINDCGDTSSSIFSFETEKDSSTSLTEIKDQELNIFPNPAIDFINIEAEEVEFNSTILAEIFDLNGKRLLTDQINYSGAWLRHRIDISELVSGSYLIRLSDGSNFITKQIIKK